MSPGLKMKPAQLCRLKGFDMQSLVENYILLLFMDKTNDMFKLTLFDFQDK